MGEHIIHEKDTYGTFLDDATSETSLLHAKYVPILSIYLSSYVQLQHNCLAQDLKCTMIYYLVLNLKIITN